MSLELIIGPMFSGKSSALISITRKYTALGVISMAYKPNLDNRHGDDEFIYTHNCETISARRTMNLLEQIESNHFKAAKVILIEEGQFFTDLYDFVLLAVETYKKHVIVAGLDGDRFRKPFGQILTLIPIADRITKLTSFCKLCVDGTPALFSYSSSSETDTVLVAGSDLYMPLCRHHYLCLN
jgi:thymidine kinase